MFGFGNKKNLEWLIYNKDFLGIVDYCKNATLMGSKQEIASGLYNIANQVGQYYNNNELAIKLYKESIKYNENDPTVYNNLATTYKRVSDFKEAKKNYYLAVVYDDKNPIRDLRLAMFSAYIDDKEYAKKYIKYFFEKGGNKDLFYNICNSTNEGGEEVLKIYKLLQL